VREIRLEIPGQPVPQPRSRVTTRGGRARPYVPAKHPIHAYRRAIELLARSKGQRFDGSVAFIVDAVFARPDSHWRKHDLKPKAPPRPRGDGDNVLKGIADALTDAGVWGDDEQVVTWHIDKRWASRYEPARTVIIVREAP